METQFPQTTKKYLKAGEFQDNPQTLTFKGWEKKANEDRLSPDGKLLKSWKDCLDYCLKYTYPEIAKDRAGEPFIGKDGQPMRNRFYDPAFPKGYSIMYHFEEGSLESGSYPLFASFCQLQPKAGEKITLVRTGSENKDKKWVLTRKNTPLPEIDFSSPEYSADKGVEEIPF